MSEFNAGPDLYNNPEIKRGNEEDDEDSSERKRFDVFEGRREREAEKRKEVQEKRHEREPKKDDKPEAAVAERPEPKHLDRPEAAPEDEAPLNEIADREQREVVQESAAQWRADIEAQLEELEPDSPEAHMAEIVAEDLKRIEETGVINPEEAADIAEDKAEIVPEEPPELLAEQAVPMGDAEGEVLLSDVPEGEPEDIATTAPIVLPVTPAAPPPQPGNTGNQPPTPPNTPPPPGPPGPHNQPPPGPGSNPNAVPPPQRQRVRIPGLSPALRTPNTAPSPDLYTSADVAIFERRAATRGLLVGGIVGYLIGRRRGRIKTEKRLIPIQQRLERQVKDIQEQLEAREHHVRLLAYERLPEPREARVAELRERPARLPRVALETLPSERPLSRLELQKPVRIERLGKTVIKAEIPAPLRPELRFVRPEQVKAMDRRELLELSEKVLIEGASLREIYEQHLIGEKGLRRLLSEYLQGKDIRHELREEMVEREIDFERDPLLRDAALSAAAGPPTAAGGSSEALQQLLEKVGATPTPDPSRLKLSTDVKEELNPREKSHQKSQRRLIDTAMITLIVVLAAAVAFLLLR